MSMNLTVRLAVLGDESLVASLNRFVHEIHVAARPDHFQPTHAQELCDWYRALLNKPTVRIWIAEEDGLAIGYVSAHFHARPKNPLCMERRWCEVDEIAIDPKWRRRGIAGTLVDKVIEEARLQGISNVEIVSWSFNEHAHLAFRQLGFRPKTVRSEMKSSKDESPLQLAKEVPLTL